MLHGFSPENLQEVLDAEEAEENDLEDDEEYEEDSGPWCNSRGVSISSEAFCAVVEALLIDRGAEGEIDVATNSVMDGVILRTIPDPKKYGRYVGRNSTYSML